MFTGNLILCEYPSDRPKNDDPETANSPAAKQNHVFALLSCIIML